MVGASCATGLLAVAVLSPAAEAALSDAEWLSPHISTDDGAAVTGAVTHANQGFAHRFSPGSIVK
jgi:hypothetical protein